MKIKKQNLKWKELGRSWFFFQKEPRFETDDEPVCRVIVKLTKILVWVANNPAFVGGTQSTQVVFSVPLKRLWKILLFYWNQYNSIISCVNVMNNKCGTDSRNNKSELLFPSLRPNKKNFWVILANQIGEWQGCMLTQWLDPGRLIWIPTPAPKISCFLYIVVLDVIDTVSALFIGGCWEF